MYLILNILGFHNLMTVLLKVKLNTDIQRFHALSHYLPHSCHNHPLTQVRLVWGSCPPVVWEYDQVGTRVRQRLHPVTRGKRGHHQDAVILLAVADPLWHLMSRIWFNTLNTSSTARIEYLVWTSDFLLQWPTAQIHWYTDIHKF